MNPSPNNGTCSHLTSTDTYINDAVFETCVQLNQGVTTLTLLHGQPLQNQTSAILTVVTKGNMPCAERFHVSITAWCPDSCPHLQHCPLVQYSVTGDKDVCRYVETVYTNSAITSHIKNSIVDKFTEFKFQLLSTLRILIFHVFS